MHVILIALLDLKGRKIRLDGRQIIDLTIRIARAIRIGVDKVGPPEVLPQSHAFCIRYVSADQSAASDAPQVKCRDAGTPHDRNCNEVIQRAPGIEHRDQTATWFQDPGNFLLCCDHVGDMVEDSVGEDKIKTIVGERQRQCASTLKPLIRQFAEA